MQIDPLASKNPIDPITKQTISEKSDPFEVDSGLSSIEKSRLIASLLVRWMDTPILPPPSSSPEDSLVEKVVLTEGERKVQKSTLASYQALQISEDINTAMNGWGDLLEQMAEEIKESLKSPSYLSRQEANKKLQKALKESTIDPLEEQLEAALHGTNQSLVISPFSNPEAFLLKAQELQKNTQLLIELEQVKDQQKGDLPVAAMLFLGAGLTWGSTELGLSLADLNTNPIGQVNEFTRKLEPLLQVPLSDLIPAINLMVAAPIYFYSVQEAISNFKNKERNNYVKIVQDFAQDILEKVNNPEFLRKYTLQLAANNPSIEVDRLREMLKFILIGVALSLLYSVEVGKIQNDQFGGMEPEEFRDFLLGQLNQDNNQASTMDKVTNQLLFLARESLKILTPEEKMIAVSQLLDYIGETREFNPMLKPIKIFEEVLNSPHQSSVLSPLKD